ncbi:MAG: IPTL-CTERM sorting domain-containing protein [candidate division NC10 bacterium]|nr:IPTL-CTERM sorting domain-containing protein [candidate division NC10 bacterium]
MNAKRILLVLGIIFGLGFPASVQSAVTLTVTPITWNVIGLDSNKPTAGPQHFPVGARVCSSVATTNVAVNFVWDSTNTNINTRPGSLSTITIASIGAGSCSDAYFEVEVTQVTAAYDTTRRYHITATDGSGTASTPTPRELYVEHLVSQSRNGITDIKLNGVSVPAGGTMTLIVGNTYTIELDGFTATQGYNQLESFINFPNTIFQVLSVSTTYSADSNTTNVPNPNDKLYANACIWENDLSSPNYRSCVGGDDKAGGTMTTTYTVKIIGGGGTSQTLNTLIYDFSGSSYHYNSDFSAGARIVNIVDPTTALAISKAFSPSSTVAGGLSTLTFTITNSTSETISGVNFTDPLPASPGTMTVASTPNASTAGCGSPTFAPTAGATSLSFTNGTLAPNSTCTVSVSVSVPSSPAAGTYHNVSNNLFVNSLDTGHHASADLTLTPATAGSGLCGLTLAQWTMPTSAGTSVPPVYSSKASDVSSAVAAAGSGITTTIDTATGNPVNSWAGTGFTTAASRSATEYFQFAVDTTHYTNVNLSFDQTRTTNNGHGPQKVDILYSTDGVTFNVKSTGTATNQGFATISTDFTGQTNASGVTYFQIFGYAAGNSGADDQLFIDNVTFTGCGTPQQPTISKAFSPNPIAVNATSTLTFTLTNPNSALLHGVKFTDTLPSGLEVAATPAASTTCGGSPSWAPTGGSTTLNFGQTTGATISAGSSCTVSVDIKATTSGPHTNVSGFISSTESGTNSGSGGSATASLTALQPPSISKVFDPNPILTNGTSTLTFLITNPNPNNSLPSVSFSDTFPTSPGAMTVASTPNASTAGCGSPTFAPGAGAGSISFSNGTIAAGATCTVKVDVTAPTAGDYTNTSGVVSTTINSVTSNGNTATGTLTVRASHPGIGISKRISTSSSGPWTTFKSMTPGTSIFYKFTIENTGDVPLSPVSVTDPTVSTASCSWPASLPVASPTQDPTATCVVGSLTSLAGDNPNIATAHGTNGGTVFDSAPSNADYIGAVPGFSLLKQISSSASGPWSSAITGVAGGSSVFYKFTIVNTGSVALSGVNVTDPNVSAAGCTFTDPLPASGGATTCVVGPVAASTTLGTHTNTATAHGTNGATTIDSSPSSASYTVVSSDPDLTITKTHSGNFFRGQSGATYTLTVKNVGLAPTSGTVTVVDTLPTGLTATGIAGTGWSCVVGTLTCTRADALGAGSSYPVITLTVNVATNAAASVTNTAVVSGGGETNTSNDSASDPTTVDPVSMPDLTITKTHVGDFTLGQTGATYTLTVTNVGSAPTSGTVTVVDTLPTGLTATGIAGAGWTCDLNTLTCTRADALGAGSSYPVITLTVDVAANAPSTITNGASVSGGGETNTGNNAASDPATVGVPSDIPTLSEWVMILLALLLALEGVRSLRTRINR